MELSRSHFHCNNQCGPSHSLKDWAFKYIFPSKFITEVSFPWCGYFLTHHDVKRILHTCRNLQKLRLDGADLSELNLVRDCTSSSIETLSLADVQMNDNFWEDLVTLNGRKNLTDLDLSYLPVPNSFFSAPVWSSMKRLTMRCNHLFLGTLPHFIEYLDISCYCSHKTSFPLLQLLSYPKLSSTRVVGCELDSLENLDIARALTFDHVFVRRNPDDFESEPDHVSELEILTNDAFGFLLHQNPSYTTLSSYFHSNDYLLAVDKWPMNFCGPTGETILHKAIQLGSTELVRVLVKNRNKILDFNSVDGFGRAPLVAAKTSSLALKFSEISGYPAVFHPSEVEYLTLGRVLRKEVAQLSTEDVAFLLNHMWEHHRSGQGDFHPLVFEMFVTFASDFIRIGKFFATPDPKTRNLILNTLDERSFVANLRRHGCPPHVIQNLLIALGQNFCIAHA
eukprot:TRINITY_DN5390_c0_g1_i10.p1 TRINITY_DN5390_c0_g1~~TRINITY_DN5390_c0_g1_i10.p1  ORF type:complete len:451 (-),score=81.23 TRINITY_DN5390_c0_g1_i10:493-1845(-)